MAGPDEYGLPDLGTVGGILGFCMLKGDGSWSFLLVIGSLRDRAVSLRRKFVSYRTPASVDTFHTLPFNTQDSPM